MKKLLFIIASALLINFFAYAQETSDKLKEAETAYASNNLDNARMALQNALEGINKEIGNEILTLLPTKLGNLDYNQTQDNVYGTTGVAGLFVNRSFGKDDKNAKIEIIGDSPLITGINAILSMPSFMSGSNANDKKVKVAGYKGMLNKSTGENEQVTYTLQVPISQTLITITFKGTYTENEVMVISNTIPLEKIAKYAQ